MGLKLLTIPEHILCDLHRAVVRMKAAGRLAQRRIQTVQRLTPFTKLTGVLLPTSEQLRIDSPRSIRSPLYPRLQTQDNVCDEVSKTFKSTIKFQGRTIAVVTCRIGPKPAFSLSNLLRSLVIHDPKSVMEKGENHGKFVGVFKNDRRASSVRDSSKEDSAGGPLPVSGRANSARF